MSSTNSNFTEPTIVTTSDLQHRSFVSFYFNGKPRREYHAKCIGQSINPNRAKSITEKRNLLNRLQFEIHKALESGSYWGERNATNGSHSVQHTSQAAQIFDKSAIRLLFEAVRLKLRSPLSRKYKRNLKAVYRQFKVFMTEQELSKPLATLSTMRIEAFLSQFSSSGTYYMNKRRDLGVLFNSAGREFDQPVVTVKKTTTKKVKAKLHRPYDKDQLIPILNYLEIHSPKLHLCCLLTYGSWLRPHEEVRLLTLSNFRNEFTEVLLGGDENKGGRVRVVYVPEYVQKVLIPIASKLSRNDNIFSLSPQPLNESYFNTAWGRAFRKMLTLGLVYENQTIYSFRHTAATLLYRNTKDVYLLQKLLGHSTIVVTLKYLRSLGELNDEDLRAAAPTLE